MSVKQDNIKKSTPPLSNGPVQRVEVEKSIWHKNYCEAETRIDTKFEENMRNLQTHYMEFSRI